MNEKQFSQTFKELAKTLGWRRAHFRFAWTEKGWRTPVEADGEGFPDWLLLRDTRCIVVELKSDEGNVSNAQYDWLNAFDDAGIEWHIFRPLDLGPTLEECEIMRVLRGGDAK